MKTEKGEIGVENAKKRLRGKTLFLWFMSLSLGFKIFIVYLMKSKMDFNKIELEFDGEIFGV